MNIDRHKLDHAKISASYEASSKNLGSFIEGAATNPTNCDLLMSNAIEAACLASVVVPNTTEMPRFLAIAGDACGRLFDAARSGVVDESIVEPRKWITGFFLGQIGRSAQLLDSLCQTTSEMLRESSTKHPEYRYLFVDALRAYRAKSEEAKQLLVQVMEATDPARPDIRAPDWVLNIDVQIVRLLFYTLEGNEDFEKALIHALQLHKEYYSKTKDRSRSHRGFLPIELNGICAIAHDQGIPFDVQSEYLPTVLVKGVI